MNLWRIPIDEATGKVLGPPEALTAPSADTRHLSVSADGRRLAYASFATTASIHKIAFDPASADVIGKPTTVVGGSRNLSHVAVSPDGQLLAYHSRDRRQDLLISRADGTGERQLTNDTAYDRNPTFSSDGQWIAFMSNRGGTYQVWLIRPDGSGLRQASKAANGALTYNQWSPDGRLVYYDNLTTNMTVFEPLRPWSEQTPQMVSRNIQAGLTFTPVLWSPDGQQLLGVGGPSEQFGMFSYSLASQQFTRLTDSGWSWAWLKDGRSVLYTSLRALLVLDTVSKTSRQLLSVDPDDFDSVALSPDSRTIYFTRAVQHSDIWLMTTP